VLLQARHPVALVTRGAVLERDLDLWAALAQLGLAVVYVTITTLDKEVARRLEPRAPTPARRLALIAALAGAGVPVGVSLSPQIPFLTNDLEQVLEAAAEAGARRAFCIPLRLPWEVAPLFNEWLQHHVPLQAERILARVRDLHGGRDNDPRCRACAGAEAAAPALPRRQSATRLARAGNLPLGLFRPPSQAHQDCLF
jgi:DNA repair photolyase